MRSLAQPVFRATPSSLQMHGVKVEVESDQPALLSRLKRRLAPFPSGGGQANEPELRFTFRIADGGGIEGARVPGHIVYRVADVEFRYDDTYDLLFVRHGTRLKGVCDAKRGVARFEVGADSAVDLELCSQTLFTVCLVELMKRHGRFSLHGAGISVGDKGILLAGPSGAGKSTLALVLLQRLGNRAGFLGDDMLFLSVGPGEIRMLGWPELIDVSEWTQRRLPAIRPRMQMAATAGRKGQIAGSEVAGAIPAFDSRPEVIVFPRITQHTKSTLIPVSLDEALLELVPNVLLTEATSSQAHLAALGSLARQCRCYRLEAGRDIEDLPDILLGLI